MYDIRTMNIWKGTPAAGRRDERLLMDLSALGLSVRSENCLRRAGCRTVADVLRLAGDDASDMMKIRNLGAKSRQEILMKLEGYRQAPPVQEDTGRAGALIRPGTTIWDREVSEYLPEGESREELEASGIVRIKDLYRSDLPEEPGWFAVRELFAGIHGRHFRDRYIGNTRLLFETGGKERT